jgi:hypothetical protein
MTAERIIQGFDETPSQICDWNYAEYENFSGTDGAYFTLQNQRVISLPVATGLPNKTLYISGRNWGAGNDSGQVACQFSAHLDFFKNGSNVGFLNLVGPVHNSLVGNGEMVGLQNSYRGREDSAGLVNFAYTNFDSFPVVSYIQPVIVTILDDNAATIYFSQQQFIAWTDIVNFESTSYQGFQFGQMTARPFKFNGDCDLINLTIDYAIQNAVWVSLGVMSTQNE